MSDINVALSNCYGFVVDATAKMRGLEVVARALNRGDLALAQIAALNLCLPDPPSLEKRDTVKQQAAEPSDCGISKGAWDATRHPRWPAGDASGRGGQFQPADASSGGDASPLVPAQATMIDPLPMPWELPWDAPIPRPTEILPPPLDIPNGQERTRPPLVNPFPGKRQCVEEWENAFEYCDEQQRKGNFRPGRGGPGKDYHSCVMGRVSEACGGNATSA
ncbi:MAG TPA: hypothetical protein VF113_06045 [Stellaceae bacterium]